MRDPQVGKDGFDFRSDKHGCQFYSQLGIPVMHPSPRRQRVGIAASQDDDYKSSPSIPALGQARRTVLSPARAVSTPLSYLFVSFHKGVSMTASGDIPRVAPFPRPY